MSEDMSKWIVPLEPDARLLPGKTVGIEVLYVTNVAIAVVLYVTEKNGASSQEALKRDISYILHSVGGAAEQFGFILPVLGFVRSAGAELNQVMETWAADQDWHRGEFSLFVDTLEISIEEWVRSLLGDPESLQWARTNIEPLSDIAYLQNAKEGYSLKEASLPVLQASLVSSLLTAWESDEDIRTALESWLNSQLQEAKTLVERGDANGPRGSEGNQS